MRLPFRHSRKVERVSIIQAKGSLWRGLQEDVADTKKWIVVAGNAHRGGGFSTYGYKGAHNRGSPITLVFVGQTSEENILFLTLFPLAMPALEMIIQGIPELDS